MASAAEYLKIVLASEYKAKGFNDAEKGVKKLNKGVKSLAKTLGIAYGATKLVGLAKASIKAFAADEKAARALELTVNNLGLAYDGGAQKAKKFIADLEKTTGVIDDQLRPAFSTLLLYTRDMTKAQELMNLAMDVSAGTGKDLQSVSKALGKAYQGDVTALKRLGAGLSSTELKAGNFEEKLQSMFKGQALQAADTFQGKLDKMNVAFENAKETVGFSLVNAFEDLANAQGFKDVSSAIARIADLTATSVSNITQLMLMVRGIFGMKDKAYFEALAGQYNFQQAKRQQQFGGIYATQYQALIKKDTKLTNAQTNAAKAQEKAAKEALKTKKLGYAMDMQQIEIVAALQKSLDEDTRTRLKLQLALLQGQTDEAQTLAQRLSELEPKNQALALFLKNLPDAKNPFKDWQSWLDAIETATLAAALRMQKALSSIASAAPIVIPAPNQPSPQSLAARTPDQTSPLTDLITKGVEDADARMLSRLNINVSLNVDGQQLASTVTDYQQNDTASGVNISTSRNNPTWALTGKGY